MTPAAALRQWERYRVALETRPLRTKALTCAALDVVGDGVAQGIEGGAVGRWRRTLATALEGLLFSGPVLHLAYGALERAFPTHGAGASRRALLHVAADQLILDPIFVLSYVFFTGAIEARPFVCDVLPSLRGEYWHTLKGAWATSLCIAPVQWAAFRFLPVQYRVLYVNLEDIVWASVVSFRRHTAPGALSDAA